jgi:hypothetical protein
MKNLTEVEGRSYDLLKGVQTFVGVTVSRTVVT